MSMPGVSGKRARKTDWASWSRRAEGIWHGVEDGGPGVKEGEGELGPFRQTHGGSPATLRGQSGVAKDVGAGRSVAVGGGMGAGGRVDVERGAGVPRRAGVEEHARSKGIAKRAATAGKDLIDPYPGVRAT